MAIATQLRYLADLLESAFVTPTWVAAQLRRVSLGLDLEPLTSTHRKTWARVLAPRGPFDRDTIAKQSAEALELAGVYLSKRSQHHARGSDEDDA